MGYIKTQQHRDRLSEWWTPERKSVVSTRFKGIPKSREHVEKVRKAVTGFRHTDEARLKMSMAKKGMPGHRKGKHNSPEHRAKCSVALKGRIISQETRDKIRQTNIRTNAIARLAGRPSWNKGLKAGDHPSIIAGSKHYLYKGTTPWHRRMRVSPEYQEWRKAVLGRDKICQKHLNGCSALSAHHIFNFIEHPALRFDIENGITLCREAHKAFHDKYGKMFNTRDQLNEFLKPAVESSAPPSQSQPAPVPQPTAA